MLNAFKHKLLIAAGFLFLATTLVFQNCSPNKSQVSTPSTSDDINDLLFYAPQSISGEQVINNGNVVLKEYRYKQNNRFFYTSRISDQSMLDSRFSNLFETTGNTITLKAADGAGLSPVYRLLNRIGFHAYTADSVERNYFLSDIKWRDEGIEGYAVKINPGASCPSSPVMTYAVNRLFHANNYKYRLVSSDTLKNQLLAAGYIDQGVLFCATAVYNASTPVIAPPSPIPAPTSDDMSLCAVGSVIANLDYTNSVLDIPISPVTSRVYKLVVPANARAMAFTYWPYDVPGTVDVAFSTQKPCAYNMNTIGYTNSFTGGGSLQPTIIQTAPTAPFNFAAKVQAGTVIYISFKGKSGVSGVMKSENSFQ